MQNTTFFITDGRRKNSFACVLSCQTTVGFSYKSGKVKQLLLGNYAFCMDYVVVCYQGQISRNVFTKFRVINYLRHLRKHLMLCNRFNVE